MLGIKVWHRNQVRQLAPLSLFELSTVELVMEFVIDYSDM